VLSLPWWQEKGDRGEGREQMGADLEVSVVIVAELSEILNCHG
jgi:hypothetical protein